MLLASRHLNCVSNEATCRWERPKFLCSALQVLSFDLESLQALGISCWHHTCQSRMDWGSLPPETLVLLLFCWEPSISQFLHILCRTRATNVHNMHNSVHLLFMYFRFCTTAALNKLSTIFWSVKCSIHVWWPGFASDYCTRTCFALAEVGVLKCFYCAHHHGSNVPDIYFRYEWNLYRLNFNLCCLICAQNGSMWSNH